MATGTNNPPGSTDARDLLANAENLDVAVNGDALTFEDRLGNKRTSYKGIEAQNLSWLGASATDPVERVNGDPLQDGDRYVNTVDSIEYYFLDGGFVANEVSAFAANLADPTDPAKGAAIVGYDGKSVADTLNRAAPYRVADEVDILVVYGQSNARGYAANSPGAPEYLEPLARVWNGTEFIALTSYTPTATDGISTGSAWAAFGNEYCKTTSRQLAIVNGGRGSQSLSELQKGTANYDDLLAWVNGAKSAIVDEGNSLGNVVVAFNQGERDSQLKTTPAAYTALLAQLWTDMKADFGASFMGIFTVGYYADSNVVWGQAIQTAQRLFARNNVDAFLAYDYLGCFGSHNKLKVDGVHYNQRGYNIMGREGAQRFVSLLFPDTDAPATDQLIERFGRISAQQSQAWNMHAAVLQKASSEPGWLVSHTSPRSHSMILDVDATTSDSVLNVRLACPARTIMSFAANFGGTMQLNGVRAAVGTGVAAVGSWATPNADGVTIVPISFYADLSIRLNMTTQVMDNAIMGAALSSLLDGVSVVWNSTGVVTVTHGAVTGFPSANIDGPTGRSIQIDSGSTSTVIRVRDAADALVDETVHLVLRNVLIRHIDLPTTADLSLQIIAADYAVW